jgi:hypothetical protein
MKEEDKGLVGQREINKEGEQTNKGKRRKKIAKQAAIKSKKKFVVDYSNESEKREYVVNLLIKANDKKLGREVTFKDLVDVALQKLTASDLEKVQRLTFKEMDRVLLLLESYNEKHETNLKLGEFLVKQLKV